MNPRIVVSLFALIAGIVAGSGIIRFQSENCVFWIASLTSGSIFLSWIYLLIKSSGWLVRGLWFYFILFILTGFILIKVEKPHLPFSENHQYYVVGKVADVNRVSDKMLQVVIRAGYYRTDSTWHSCRGRIVMLCRPDKDTIKIGESREFGPVRISRIPTSKPGQKFRSDLYWLSRGVCYQAWVYPGQSHLVKATGSYNLIRILREWQSWLVARIQRMGLSSDSSGLLAAMLFGDRKQLDKDLVNEFSQAGIVHVLSVSGLHVGIIYLVINWLLKRFIILPGKLRPLAAMACVWFYTGLTGLSPSACRAAGMISLFAVSGMLGRNLRGIEILASTALLHCLIDPWVVFSCGAQLSYLAVGGIFIWLPYYSRSQKGSWLKRKIVESCGVSLSAQSLLIPVLIYWFGWFPLYFLIGNLILMPLMVACFYAGIALVIVDLAGIDIGFANILLDMPIAVSIKGSEILGHLPGNQVYLKPPDLIWVLLYYGCFTFLLTYLNAPAAAKWKKFVLIFCMLGLIDLTSGLIARIF